MNRRFFEKQTRHTYYIRAMYVTYNVTIHTRYACLAKFHVTQLVSLDQLNYGFEDRKIR